MYNKNIKRMNYAVSEIVGTVLLLSITISLLVFVNVALFSIQNPPESTIVDIIGMSADENHVIFSHVGGNDLPLDTVVVVTVGGLEIRETIGDLLDEESSKDGFWNIGEELIIEYDIRGLQVEARIIDSSSNTVLMSGILQEGDQIREPYALTLNSTDIQANSAKLSLEYNFWKYSGFVRFSYRKSGDTWIYSSWVARSGESTFESNINGLVTNTLYDYKAELKWGENLTEGQLKTFRTAEPNIETLDGTDIKTRSAKLWLQYDFKGTSGAVSFSYRISGESWVDTSWENLSDQGTFWTMIIDLTPKKQYEFKARLKYDMNIIEGQIKSFTTWSVIMGMWTFSEGIGTTAYDISGLDNHGIIFGADWTVGVNTTGLSFDGIDDYVRVYDSSSLDVTEDITIEAWIKPLDNNKGLIGDISNSIIDTSLFGSDYGRDSDIIQISNNLYAIAFRGDGDDGYIATAMIDNSGIIKNIIDYFEFDVSYCVEPDIIHITGNIFAIVYEGPDYDGFIKTVEIDLFGQITDFVIDTLEFDIVDGSDPNIIHINGYVYAIVYVGFGGDGYVTTVEIMDNGIITDFIIDKTIFCDTEAGTRIAEPRIIKIGINIYAIIFRNPDDDGEIRSIIIMDDGTFNNPSKFDGAYSDKFTFDQYDAWRPGVGMNHISSDIYACVYRGRDGKGTLLTLRMTAAGDIDDNIIDKFYFEPLVCFEPELAYITSDFYAITYRGVDNDGFLSIVEIAGDGTINKTVISSYEFDGYDCYKPTISYHTGDIFIIAYTRYNEGLLKTVRIPSNGIISISAPVIHTSRYTLFDFIEPSIVQVYGNIYAIACRGLDSDGYVRTTQISNSGLINNNFINCLEFDVLDGYNPKIIHVGGEIFAIAYRGPGSDGFVKTIQIMNDGQIVGVIDTLEFDTSAGYEPDIINVYGNIYAIAYRGPSNHGFIKTVEIDGIGLITDIVIDSLEFETSYCFEPDMIHTIGDLYAISYRGPGDDGFVKTVQIISNGDIHSTPIDYFEYDTAYGHESDIINISNNVYAIVTSHQNLGGYLTTIEIADTGIITKNVLDSTRWDNRQPSGDDDCYDPQIIHIGNWVYAIVYRGEYNSYIKTLRIGSSGDISDVNDDYLMFDGDGFEPQIIHIDGDIYSIPFRGLGSNAKLITIEIKKIGTTRDVVYKQNAYGIRADETTIFTHINSRILSTSLLSGFNYVVLTYNRSLSSNQIKLYINGVKKTETSETSPINSNGNNLIMGEYNCIIDEVTIWNVALTDAQILANYNLLKP
jgi:hypothetical protein